MGNKTIVVTGANRGIGLEISRQLASQGHCVIAGVRDINKGQQATSSLVGEINVHRIDMLDPGSFGELAHLLGSQYGHVDVLINNAGTFSSAVNAVESADEDIDKVLDVNFRGPWKLTVALLPLLGKSADPRVIMMSSGMGANSDLVGGYGPYRLSKNALNALTIQLAAELSGRVMVNSMCPGWVRTDMGGPNATRSVEEGADTAVWLATADGIPSGKFWRSRAEIPW